MSRNSKRILKMWAILPMVRCPGGRRESERFDTNCPVTVGFAPPRVPVVTKHKFLRLWSLLVGSMDALTGALLIFAPGLVLQLLKIQAPPAGAMVFVSWIGVFVMSVGLSYGLALGGRRSRGEAVWMFTSLVRILVAAFLTTKILGGSLQMEWMLVAAADASVALVQVVILRTGWWREGTR